MNKVSFMVHSLDPSQLTYTLVRNINNEYSANNHATDYMIFYNLLSRYSMKPKCAIMSMAEVYGQEGMVIATTAELGLKLTKIAGPTQRLLYLWDLDWIRGKNRNYELYAHVYQHPSLKLICRSQAHATLLKNAFNVSPIGIVPDFNLSLLKEVV